MEKKMTKRRRQVGLLTKGNTRGSMCPKKTTNGTKPTGPPPMAKRYAKWIVKVDVYDPKEHYTEKELEDFEHEIECEIAVLREDNKFGMRSYGWDGFSDEKLIICDEIENGQKGIDRAIKMANIIAGALNKAKF
jgi:hypothetical protein